MMTMPVIVEIVDEWATESDLDSVFWYFEHVEKKFNFLSGNSETTKINKGQITEPEYSDEMREV
ncbi:MAG: FAD:protein FMN transferase, partial [Candidatus Vogelbacteria bacterium]|nr:FAD:protein FMN transferase [Candidatus Vogelbacteria bacterium]